MRIFFITLFTVFVFTVLAPTSSTSAMTAAEYLKALPKPQFRNGHKLPRLTRFGWTLPFEARVELAEHWGYALEFGGYATMQVVNEALEKPQSEQGKAIALAEKEPEKFPLFVICNGDFPEGLPDETWVRDENGNFLNGKNVWSKDAAASETGNYIWSPEAPDSVFEMGGSLRAAPLKKLIAKAPIAIILNGGEYALGVTGAHQHQWERDSRILKAKGNRSWFDYISERKGHQEEIIARHVRAAVPSRQLYIYYSTGSEAHRNRYSGWDKWAVDFKELCRASDLPSNEFYFKHFNSGWTGENDLLTQALNTIGYQIAHGASFSYNWLCAGWPRGEGDSDFSEIRRYIGYLKCLYTAGMIGGNAGYYAYPKGGFETSFEKDNPPHWLLQLVSLGQVHAQFSHLELLVRESELLPGPNRHHWSKDQPAYEFPTGTETVRVLVRKRKNQAQWIVTVWSTDGADRDLKVTLPQLGQIAVKARGVGSVYFATLRNDKVELTLLDADGAQPSRLPADFLLPVFR